MIDGRWAATRTDETSPLHCSPWLVLAAAAALCTLLPLAASAADCPDADGDGFVVCGGCDVPAGKACGDCNDGNAAIQPGATERCDDNVDNDCDGSVNEGFSIGEDCALCDGPDCPDTFCVATGPLADCGGFSGNLCLTGSAADPPQNDGVVCAPDGVTQECALPEAPLAIFAFEGLGTFNPGNIGEATCSDGQDNDCDDFTDLDDDDCFAPEICDGLDNDGDGFADENFPLASPGNIGNLCMVGVGACERSSTYACEPDGLDASCGATPGSPKNEGVSFGLSCADGEDNDCDGLTDALDPACAGFGDPELCGNGLDDDGDGLVDEGFPQIGQACAAGIGACADIDQIVCNGSGTGVVCGATPSAPPELVEVSCNDFIDNDCDGFADVADTDCGAAFADLGVTCSLPYQRGRPGKDCTGKHLIEFDAEDVDVTLKADLLALDTDGTLLDIIENVGWGEEVHLASRTGNLRVDSKTNKHGTRHTVFAPMPLLKVTGTRGAVSDVAYCSIMPWLEVTDPDGLTISLSETNMLEVAGLLPLVDVDTVAILLDGIDILSELGIDPATAFPTNGSPLCAAPGDCVVQVTAGCGDGSLVDVEISNLRVAGLDTDIAMTAKDGVGEMDQVNTFAFEVSGLPAGGHIFHVSGTPLPLPKILSAQCLVDDLEDTGTASAFGIQITSPVDQQVIAAAPVLVQGKVCGGNEIAELRIQGNSVDAGIPPQVCTTGDGMSSADECVLDFDEPIDETDLQDAVAGVAGGGTFHAGSNRLVADASDVEGNRTFNTEVVFGLGDLQAPAPNALTSEEQGFLEAGRAIGMAVGTEVTAFMNGMMHDIDPAFVVGLEESAAQDFFNEKCSGAIDQFSARAEANLSNKTFATVDFKPGCSCDLNNVPVVLEDLDLIPSPANPTCAVDFETDQIGVTINLPDIRVQVGAHRSCTTRGLFGECLARTRIDMTAISQISDPVFRFVITEEGIEMKEPPSADTQVFTWIVEDDDGTDLFFGGNCNGGLRAGEFCIADSQCPGSACGCARDGSDPSQCSKRGEGDGFDPITQQNSGIECWGAAVCNVFASIGAVLVEIFTLGFADGFELVGIIDFDVEFREDFLEELDGTEPDPLELDEVEIDEDKVASFEQGTFTPGDIDVEIEDGGLKIEFPATFMSLQDDPMGEDTLGAVLTPAMGPTIPALIAAGDEISIGIADDVFNQLFASMKEAGSLQAFCTDGDGLTVDNLLPAAGCDTLGDPNTLAGATVQGICHAVRSADCSGLTAPTPFLTETKIGTCTGFQGGDCTTLGLVAKAACNLVPARNIRSDDSVLLCARQDMEPRLLFQDDDASDNTVDTDLLLNDTNVVFAIDKANDGYTGDLEALQGCFGEEGDAAPDCLLYAVCLDLTLKTTMGIDNSTCEVGETGFVFALNQVIASGLEPGVMCSAATTAADTEVLGEGIDSVVIDTVADAAEAFTPPFCAEGLTLGGVLDFTSPDAKMFAITTDEATMGFADFLFLTGSLGSP